MIVKLWKENRIDQEWSLTSGEIAKRFCESMEYTNVDWIRYNGLRHVINIFIISENGLNSVYENEEHEEILESVRQEILKIKPDIYGEE